RSAARTRLAQRPAARSPGKRKTGACITLTEGGRNGHASEEGREEDAELLQDASADARAGAHQYASRQDREHVGDAQGLCLGRREWPAHASERGPHLSRTAGQGALL